MATKISDRFNDEDREELKRLADGHGDVDELVQFIDFLFERYGDA